MLNEHLAHELAKERMRDAMREAQRAWRRKPTRHAAEAGLWSILWKRVAHLWHSFTSLTQGRIALKGR
jgi:hypothetical protein